MKKASKAVLAAALGMAMSTFALAQNGSAPAGEQQGPPQQRGEGRGPGGPGRGMPSPEERLKRMTESLSLTADQQTKIKGFMDSEKSQMDKLRDNTSLSQDERRESAMKIRQETQTSIRGVLTADQQAKFDKQQAEMRNRGGERRGPPNGQNGDKPQDPPPPPPAS